MKKIYLFMAILATVALAGCKGDYDDDWSAPQHNDEETAVGQLLKLDVKAPADIIQLEEVTDSMVQVFVPGTVDCVEGTKYYVTLSDAAGNSQKVECTQEGYMAKSDLENVISTFFGKKQEERTLNAVVTAEYTTNGTTIKATADQYVLKVMPAVPDINYWIWGKQNNRNSKEKTLPLMPVTKKNQTVTTYFSGKIDTKLWGDDTFGVGTDAYGATGGNKSVVTWDFSVGGGYICPPSAGWYTLTFDFSTYKYTFTKLEDQQPTEYSYISLIGAFNQWSGDVDLTEVPTSSDAWKSHCWYALNVELAAGELKLRADHDWTTSWGGGQTVKETTYGVGDATGGSGNINVEAGTYNIYFNDITGEFLFIQQ